MRKVSALSVVLISSIMFSGCGEKYRAEAKNQFFFNQQASLEEMQTEKEMLKASTITIVEEEKIPGKIEVETLNENKRPDYKILDGLPLDVLDYIYEQSEKTGLSYEMVMGIAFVESKLDVKAKSPTNDFGLFQINKNNIVWLSEKAGIKNPDLFNPRHNTLMATVYLSYLRDYYKDKGFSDEESFKHMIVAFHMGIEGSKRIKNIDSNTYLNKVRKAKLEIEESLVQN